MEKTINNNKQDIQSALNKLKARADSKEAEIIDVISSLYESFKNVQNKTAEKVRDTAGMVNDSVQHHPWSYIGGAALFGFLIGFLTRR